MPDRAARVETLRAAAPLRIGPATLVAIERVAVRAVRGDAGVWVSAARDPCAIVVRDERGTRVLDVGGAGLSLDGLRTRIPELDALLAPRP